MRFIHTADWHLGRVFGGQSLIQDQEFVLREFVELVRESKPDAVLISGDIYDRAVPPAAAVELYDQVLSQLIDLHVPVIAIAGNHDGPQRLAFGRQLMSQAKYYIAGLPQAEISVVTLHDQHGPVHFHALPYAEPVMVRSILQQPNISTHQEAMSACLASSVERIAAGGRHVLLAHAFVQGGSETPDSERPLSVGGADRVNASLFEKFAYVALGHLHQPHAAGRPQIRYSGSLLKYSFAEEHHVKGVELVELTETGAVQREHIALHPRRDVRSIRVSLEELETQPYRLANQEDYLQVILTDSENLMAPINRVREFFPNTLELLTEERLLNSTSNLSAPSFAEKSDMPQPIQMIEAFFEQRFGDSLTHPQYQRIQQILNDLRLQEQEIIL
ncbi:exonuclease SbcCD subunit D [Deinococcus rubellus]|uniref:exonuclease SbcCD subunit D n=1 Tax=Deinococcus rubellus TaxID=1889240 RepID=UPI0031E5E4AD